MRLSPSHPPSNKIPEPRPVSLRLAGELGGVALEEDQRDTEDQARHGHDASHPENNRPGEGEVLDRPLCNSRIDVVVEDAVYAQQAT